jgi:cation:H+ antiporter
MILALTLAAGLALLVFGADLLVRGASRLAERAGVSHLVIGLTVVAYGTSAPELAVSLGGAFTGQSDIAVGNVIGSNIFNVLLILGACAIILPLRVATQVVRREVPIMIAVSAIAHILSLDGSISRPDGAILFAGIVGYSTWTILAGRRESRIADLQIEAAAAIAHEPPPVRERPKGSGWIDLSIAIAGLVLLVTGAKLFVDGAIETARLLGVSELVIGLTVVAAGTSLPEVATSIVATIRGERDIAVGNVIGSNIFNLLSVLGMTAMLSPAAIPVAPSVLSFDLPFMTAVAFACFPIFWTGSRISRWEGFVFLAYYVGYTLYLILAAAKHDALETYRWVLVSLAVPLTALTIGVVVYRSWRTGNGAPRSGSSES